jgi:hypothetical protein
MIPTAIAVAPAPTPALPGAPAETPVSADFMALLLLLMGVGSDAPQAKGPATGQRQAHDDDQPAAQALPAAELGTAVGAVAGAALLVAPTLTAPLAPTMPIDARPATPSAAPAPANAHTMGRLQSEGPRQLHALPSAAPAPGEVDAPVASVAPVVDLPAAAAAAPAAEPAAARADVATLTAGADAAPAHDDARARAAQHALHDLDPIRPEAPGADLPTADTAPAMAPAPAARVVSADAGAARERFERDERQREGARDAGPSAIGFTTLVETGGIAPLKPSQPAAEVSAPAVVEPRAAVEQIVQAASVVVRGDEAEMHLQLDPPALGTVHVSATSRGTALEILISADRPETQVLLTQALPEIQHTLTERGLSATAVSVVTTPTTGDGRRAPDRRPTEPRDRSTSHPPDRRRTAAASRRVSALDITV